MTDAATTLIGQHDRGGWVRLRTLILLRWLALAGQLATLTVAALYLDLMLNIGLCLMAIGASVVANLMAMVVYPENKRLSDWETMLTLLFDISQLSVLLYLTGGLNNPFALLILAPVTISAAALRLRFTVVLGLAAIALVSLLALYHLPLRAEDGLILRQPPLFVLGFWLAVVIGIVFEAGYAWRVTSEIHSMSQALLATQMALSREQKLTDLGGVVAAAAHELGTPLATIKLVSSELIEDLADRPELREDVELLRDQADRCRDILRSMGRAGKEDLHMRHAPLSAVVRESAEPHSGRGKALHFDFSAAGEAAEDADISLRGLPHPVIRRRPEIIHGLRNLVQNAVDFAHANVWVDGRWDEDRVSVRIIDDGPGFAPHLLARIGDPFLGRKRPVGEDARRPGYEGMGLGLFIAKTLLERSGAEVSFANASDSAPTGPAAGDPHPADGPRTRPGRSGAIVEVVWPRAAVVQTSQDAKAPLGENQPITR